MICCYSSIAFLVAASVVVVGCEAEGEHHDARTGSQHVPGDVARQQPPSSRSHDAVAPVQTTAEGRNKFNTFILQPGQVIRLERGGEMRLVAVDRNEVVWKREHKWSIPTSDHREYPIGNREYLRLLAVSQEPPSVKIQIRVYDRPAWDTAF
jgi:hypothetical protein